MCSNISKELTFKVTKKIKLYEVSPAGNMAQKLVLKTASGRVIMPGEEVQVDIRIFANNSKKLRHIRAFKKYTGAFTTIR